MYYIYYLFFCFYCTFLLLVFSTNNNSSCSLFWPLVLEKKLLLTIMLMIIFIHHDSIGPLKLFRYCVILDDEHSSFSLAVTECMQKCLNAFGDWLNLFIFCINKWQVTLTTGWQKRQTLLEHTDSFNIF